MRYVEISSSDGKVYNRVYEKDGKLVAQIQPKGSTLMDDFNEDKVTLEELVDKSNGYFNVSDIIEGELPNGD